MANALLISLNDKTKAASCKETVALCAKYQIEVTPPLEGSGKLVLHRRRVTRTPDGRQAFIAGFPAVPSAWRWDANEVYAVVDLTTEDGHTTGELNLRHETLVKDFVSRFQPGAEAPLVFAIYDMEGNGLAGDGEFNVKVVEPYYITEDQNFHLFKGDPGNSITAITYKSEDAAGNFIYEFTFTDGSHIDVTMPRGPMGAPSVGSYAKNAATGKFHLVTVVTNGLGQNTLRIDPNGVDTPPSDASYMMLNGEQTVVGIKTFSAQIIANGGVTGNLTGNVTGNLTGDVNGGLTVPDGKTATVPDIDDVTDSTGKAANTKFVRGAIDGSIPLFSVALMPSTPSSEWADMNPSTSRLAWLSADDYPEAYASLVTRMNTYRRTSHPKAIDEGFSILDGSQPEFTDTYTNDAEAQVVAGQFISADNMGVPVESAFKMKFTFDYDDPGWNDSTNNWQAIFSPRMDFHLAGTQYVDSNGYVKQRTAPEAYSDSEYDVGGSPKYKAPSLFISNSTYAPSSSGTNTKLKIVASTNGTSNDVTKYVNLGSKLQYGEVYSVELVHDGAGTYTVSVEGVSTEFSWSGTIHSGSILKFEHEIVLGNHWENPSVSFMRGVFYLGSIVSEIEGTTTYNGSSDQSYSTSYGVFDSEGFVYIYENSSDNQSMVSRRFFIDTANRRFKIPLNRYQRDNIGDISGKYYMKVR